MTYLARPGGLTTTLSGRWEDEFLAEGKVEELAQRMETLYRVSGEIIHGKKLGRKLGFPTANMQLAEAHPLRSGIYAVYFTDQNGCVSEGVASFGRRPTVDSDGRPLLETYLFDFDGDLYGQECHVSFVRFLRPELKFENLDKLVDQMQLDEREAMLVLSRGVHRPEGHHGQCQ